MTTDAGQGPPRPTSMRERIVRTASEMIRTKGVSGTSLREVVTAAGAPRGSLQHYFPDGKEQLVTEALLWAAAYASGRVVRAVDRLDPPTPGGLFTAMVDQWRGQFRSAGYAAGCPLVAATADTVAINENLRAAVSRAFDGWHSSVASALIELGVPAARSDSLALLMLSTLEGAIVLARARRDLGPLDAAAAELAPLLDAAARPRRRRNRTDHQAGNTIGPEEGEGH
ncbi:TetR/AcrR family transcriptional regulator [Actinomadura sp. RB99]|uniref:TetR/AcrR family transcriptional regulator n=1 Tax=Actinomadura sp. RB99 TaxID=2691577 RepID=UPI0016885420|nr:TetR/AcrR family transcriptional regulator [Actinomadura sp. RB99]